MSAPLPFEPAARPLTAEAARSVDQTRLRIIEATRELFAAKGSRGTTTREIAERAGVNEATVFRHFGTKAELLNAMRDHFCDSEAQIESTLETLQGTLEEQLRRLGERCIDQLEAKSDLIRMSLAEIAIDPEGAAATWRGPRRTVSRLTEFMQGHVAAGRLRGEPRDLARLFVAVFFSYVIGTKLWQEQRPSRERLVQLAVDLFLNGAKAA